MKFTLLQSAVVVASLVVGGCGLTGQPQALVPSQFVRSRAGVGPNPIGQPVGQSGALAYGELHSPLLPDEYPNTHPNPAPTVSALVQRDVPAPGEGAGTSNATTQPSDVRPRPDAGQATGYQVVGTVVATVNTTPIFADKVLATLDHELAAEARKYGPQEFRAVASQDIANEVRKRIDSQLEIEQATVSLTQDAKSQAQLQAQLWRRQQIVAAGGSQAIARQRALESGETLDEQTADQYNTALVQLYYQQHVIPRIHVTAGEMRRYYADHLESEYSKHAEARFRLIRIDIARSGSPEEAAAKANRIIDDLKAGANFEDAAAKFNDDPSLAESKGDVGWMQKGAFKYDSVEQAVWALQPGHFTDRPIEVSDPSGGNAFYVAKLDDRRGGNVQPFDDPAVQSGIHQKLASQQFAELRMKHLQEREDKNAVVTEPHGLETAVDMAMQRYPLWASAR